MRKTCIVTGANSGIGYSVAKKMASENYKVILAVRDVQKGEDVAYQIRKDVRDCELSVVHLDLASLESVRTAANEILSAIDRLDVLVNNAGIFPMKYMQTQEGYELAYGVNYLGPFLFTSLLIDLIRSTAKQYGQSRIILVSSYGYKMSKGLNFKEPLCSAEDFSSGRAYGDSKLSLIYYAWELAARYGKEGVIAHAINPGTVRTNLVRPDNVSKLYYAIVGRLMKLPILTISPEKPAEAIYFLASGKEAGESNGLYWNLKKAKKPAVPQDAVMQSKNLWDASRKYVGL